MEDLGGLPECYDGGARRVAPSHTWPVAPHSSKECTKLRNIVLSDNVYSQKSPDDLDERYKTVKLPIGVIWSIRNTFVKQKIVERHVKIMRCRRSIMDDYEHNVPICAMSVKWSYPPLCLLRAIFTWRGTMSPREITALFANKDPVLDDLPDADKAIYLAARKCDADPDSAGVAEDAQRREDAFVARFAQFPHKTQTELVLEQTEKYGMPRHTPDILFYPAIKINGRPVRWIDYKAYVGVPNTFISNKIRKQATKYRREYGSGAVVFRGGFVEGMEEAIDAMCLAEESCPFSRASDLDDKV